MRRGGHRHRGADAAATVGAVVVAVFGAGVLLAVRVAGGGAVVDLMLPEGVLGGFRLIARARGAAGVDAAEPLGLSESGPQHQAQQDKPRQGRAQSS